MTGRIWLIHALQESMAPARAAFARDWPEADIADLLDDSLSRDSAAAAALTPAPLAFYSAAPPCADARPGLEVGKLSELIKKHNVDLYPGMKGDPLGKKVAGFDEWMTGVAAVTSIGQYRCSVYHNQRFVTRVEPFSG